MCYSAMVWEDYGKYVRTHGAVVSFPDFVRLYTGTRRPRTPKGMDDAFLASGDPAAAEIAAAIRAERSTQRGLLETELFALRKRLADAERKLAARVTRGASEDARIARDKIERTRVRLEDLGRTTPRDRDRRIFPQTVAPVLVSLDGARTLLPMRYGCRPAGKPASHDQRYPGTYNARRDNLERFWRGQFGHTHAVIAVERFFENVERMDEEGRPMNVVLEFRPRDDRPMWVACLWSRWTDPRGQAPDLLSFAAITDEPPAEVAAAGHDRCIVPLRDEHLDAWLNPQGRSLAELQALLDDRPRPYYEHRLAA